MKCSMLNDVMDVIDCEGKRRGDEENVGGFDLVYDNGYVDMDPADSGWSSYLGAKIEPGNRSPAKRVPQQQQRPSSSSAGDDDVTGGGVVVVVVWLRPD